MLTRAPALSTRRPQAQPKPNILLRNEASEITSQTGEERRTVHTTTRILETPPVTLPPSYLEKSKPVMLVGDTRYACSPHSARTFAASRGLFNPWLIIVQQIKCIVDDVGQPCRRCAKHKVECVLDKNLQTIIDEKVQ
jgi:hypothetical protein